MTTAEPPRAERRPTVLRHGDDERVDDWFWLRDRDDPAMLAYLEAENRFTDAGLAHTAALRKRIFEEIKARVRETDVTAPVARGGWEYFSRSIEGLDYSVHCRRPRSEPTSLPDPDAPPGAAAGEAVVLDENALAKGHDYFALRGLALSPDQQRVAYSVDLDGGELATLRFRDLATGRDLDVEITGTYYGLAWANDSTTIFYVRPDAAMRPYQVWRHELGAATADDTLVLQEDDEKFYVSIGRARSGAVLVITIASKLTTEVHVIDADRPTTGARCLAPREQGVEYHVDHHRTGNGPGRFFILTNADGAENFKVMVCDADATTRQAWREVVAHRADVRIADVDAFARHVVLSERAEGLEQLRVLAVDASGAPEGPPQVVAMPDEVYSAWAGPNPEFDTGLLRIGYTSLVAPLSDLEYDVGAGTRRTIKVQQVADYEPTTLDTQRTWATAPDGTRVPISIVHRRGLARDGRSPLLLYGYGSYEVSIDPTFSTSRVSLLSRGVAFAIAHVRGGGELGRPWYDDGKLGHKRNTFTDFIACADHLIAEGFTSADRLVARGGSAGGLLMGAVANMAPERFRAVVAEVPFVDCLTTMLDETLPLTVTEWEEWGDPVHDPDMYDYIKGYAPYDNVADRSYPAMLVTAGLNDPRVQYWEPAKWVAKLRATVSAPTAPLYLKTELGAGHHGPSGRYGAWEEEALVLAFVLDQVGITD
jgi:oligopeptidase B